MKSLKQHEKQIYDMETQSLRKDKQILIKKNNLLKQEIQFFKQNQKHLENQLNCYRKVVFESADISNVLQMQHSRILQLQTQLQITQKNYQRSLTKSGSQSQTQYGIKCRQLERQLQKNQIEHQKQIKLLKDKLMRMNASQIVEIKRNISTPNELVPLKNKKLL